MARAARGDQGRHPCHGPHVAFLIHPRLGVVRAAPREGVTTPARSEANRDWDGRRAAPTLAAASSVVAKKS